MPTMSSEHVSSSQSALAQNCKEVCPECARPPLDESACECADGKVTNKQHASIEGTELKFAGVGSQSKAMSSCAAHPTKSSNDDQNDLSLSSSSSSSSKNSTCIDGEKKSKSLKGLLKKKIDPNQDFIKSHNKRVKFSETMQVFCYELPDNQMPQIIALKSPAELNLMEFQSYMFEPPADFQDFLTFEPPPDYRDFIANSLSVFRNEVTFDYIDDDDDDSEGTKGPSASKQAKDKKGNHISSLVITNDPGQNSKWQSMILENNLDSLEEEQIIGVLKEDDILQAIGSQITLPVSSDPNGPPINGDRSADYHLEHKAYAFEVLDPHEHYEENLSSEDFPVHHLNSYLLNSSGNIDEEDEDACCIDSSPNGSLQDLASDSSITSQDTIILINQNKTFHLEPFNNNNANVSPKLATNPPMGDNIYENVQHHSNGSGAGSEKVLPNGKTQNELNQSKRDIALPPDKAGIQRNGQSCEALYENTSELLAQVCSSAPLVAGHMSNSESRMNSELCKQLEGGEQVKNNQNLTSKFKQNLMFYENMMQQGSAPINSNSLNVNSGKQAPSEEGRLVPNVLQQQVAIGVASGETTHALPVRLPLYTIVDASRASSSSSLSSTSSSSSSLVSSTSNIQLPPTFTTLTANLSSASGNSMQPPAQVSPNSSSSSSSLSSMGPDYLGQYAQKTRANVPRTAGDSVDPSNLVSVVSSNTPNFVVPSSLNEPRANAAFCNVTPAPMQQSPRPPGIQTAPICVLNNNGGALRPGQVVYRYPAFIQQTAPNGVSTIRPVQYIVQTNPQTGVQSVIYNPRFVINNNNQASAYSISPAPGAAGNAAGPGIGTNSVPGSSSQSNGPPQMMPGHADSSIPVRRIIVPQGAVLAPRIMHLHPQHHKQTPPPYQYYVQQRQQQAIFAYQQNVQLRPGAPAQLQQVDSHQGHTEFPNPSEIRRRDGLYAYPQVLLKNEENRISSQSAKTTENSDEKDELEEFVQQEQQRTDRIKKRYSFTEDEDPTFGFARRPSVRGIRAKFGTTNEIIQQMTSTMPKSTPQQKVILTSGNMAGQHITPVFIEPTLAAYGTIPKKAQFININPSAHPQMISIVKQMNDMHVNDAPQPQVKSQTLPRQLSQMQKSPASGEPETVRIVEAGLLNGPNSALNATLSRDQLKLQIQKQLERQMQPQVQPKQQAGRVAINSVHAAQRPLAGDERGMPEGASYSPSHPGAGAEAVPFGVLPHKDPKASLVSENNKPNADLVYYSLNV